MFQSHGASGFHFLFFPCVWWSVLGFFNWRKVLDILRGVKYKELKDLNHFENQVVVVVVVVVVVAVAWLLGCLVGWLGVG